jgi:sulfonate transport system permease protein
MTLADASGRESVDETRRESTGDNRSVLHGFLHASLGVIVPLIAIVCWELSVRYGLVQGRLMPAPTRVVAVFGELASSGELVDHIWATLQRVLLGFVCGAAAGTFLGALCGGFELVRRLFDPLIQALRAIPSIAWVPLFILWFGIFEVSKVTLIAAGVFFPVYLGVLGAMASVDRKLIEVGRIFRLSPVGMIRRVLLPAIFPAWVVALRSGLGLGFMFVVAAEIMGASEGLGYLLVDGQQLGKPDQILVALVTFAVLGKICDGLMVLASRPLLSWQDTARKRL